MGLPDILEGEVTQAQLNAMSEVEICARFQLSPHESGGYCARHEEAAFVLLPVGEIWPWQKSIAPLSIEFLAGAPVALSWSADGINGEAAHLGQSQTHHRATQNLAAHVWHTGETLGNWSLLCLNGYAADDMTLAPADWFPTPMGAPQGTA
jgi:predicted cupin superfamily sugar epimerase